jgi:radical SAM superfamily enzyme YgiQ (UPF0313 family)
MSFASPCKPFSKPPTRRADQRILLITPPLLQPNTPYAASPVLAGFLQAQGFAVAQADLSLALLLRLFSTEGLRQVTAAMRRRRVTRHPPSVRHFLRQAERYAQTVEEVVAFLQGNNGPVAARILAGGWLPCGARLQQALNEGPGAMACPITRHDATAPSTPAHDLARHLASLYLDDLADAIREGLDPRFGFARYAESLALAAPRFEPLQRALTGRLTLVDQMLAELTTTLVTETCPTLVGLTVPFPGTLYGALRIARQIRQLRPRTRIALGGGYVNTELRELDDPRVFDYVDYICLDDGEEPLLRLAQTLAGARVPLVRTLLRQRGRVVRCGFAAESGAPADRTSPPAAALPDFASLPLERYLPMAESTNPMHRLWSDHRWLKLPLAHGCYWHKCRFCDTALDYIGRYVPPRAAAVVATMQELHRRTGLAGFHFTDEALAPALLRQLAETLMAQRTRFTWWGNIRFERAFTRPLARQLARAGCVAVTGGLECAHDRLLALMNKGITQRDAARTCQAFAAAGIHVHTYLMYGFPTQTVQETVDGLEFVRQLFAAGVVQSAYWHRFALTCHSPIAAAPEAFGIRIRRSRPVLQRTFARNELAYEILPGFGADEQSLQMLGRGLRVATYNYMLGQGLDEPLALWFAGDVPEPSLPPDFVARA